MWPFCCLALPILLGAAQDDLPAGWKMVAPKEAGYSVAMPGTPSEKKQQVKTATTTLNVVIQVAEGRNESHFVVSHCDFPAGDLKKSEIDKRLDQARDGAVASARGKKRSEEAIKLGAASGPRNRHREGWGDRRQDADLPGQESALPGDGARQRSGVHVQGCDNLPGLVPPE